MSRNAKKKTYSLLEMSNGPDQHGTTWPSMSLKGPRPGLSSQWHGPRHGRCWPKVHGTTNSIGHVPCLPASQVVKYDPTGPPNGYSLKKRWLFWKMPILPPNSYKTIIYAVLCVFFNFTKSINHPTPILISHKNYTTLSLFLKAFNSLTL